MLPLSSRSENTTPVVLMSNPADDIVPYDGSDYLQPNHERMAVRQKNFPFR